MKAKKHVQSLDDFKGKDLEVFYDADDEKFVVAFDCEWSDDDEEEENPGAWTSIAECGRKCDAEFILKALRERLK